MVTPPFDTALAAAVKAQEKKTSEKAPYFGAESQKDALKLDAWKDIGKAWKRAPKTCWDAYAERYSAAGASQVRYDATVKAAVRSGERDEELKRAAAVCHDAERDIYNYAYQYMASEVDGETVRARLKALDFTAQKEVWLAELHDEL